MHSWDACSAANPVRAGRGVLLWAQSGSFTEKSVRHQEKKKKGVAPGNCISKMSCIGEWSSNFSLDSNKATPQHVSLHPLELSHGEHSSSGDTMSTDLKEMDPSDCCCC